MKKFIKITDSETYSPQLFCDSQWQSVYLMLDTLCNFIPLTIYCL